MSSCTRLRKILLIIMCLSPDAGGGCGFVYEFRVPLQREGSLLVTYVLLR